MRKSHLIIIGLAVAGLLAIACSNPERSPNDAVSPILDYCELANDPEKYDGQVIRVRATLWFNMHGYKFRDKRCDGDSKETALTIPQDGTRWEDIERKIAKDLNLNEYTPWEFPEIIAVGKFRRVTPSRASDAGYDNSELIFEIMEVEKAIPRTDSSEARTSTPERRGYLGCWSGMHGGKLRITSEMIEDVGSGESSTYALQPILEIDTNSGLETGEKYFLKADRDFSKSFLSKVIRIAHLSGSTAAFKTYDSFEDYSNGRGAAGMGLFENVACDELAGAK